MKLINNKLIGETRECYACEKGVVKIHTPCPNLGKNQYGKECKFCKSHTKHHNDLKPYILTECGVCNGRGEIKETIFDFIPSSIIQDLNFTIEKSKGKMPWIDRAKNLLVPKRIHIQACRLVKDFGEKVPKVVVTIFEDGITLKKE